MTEKQLLIYQAIEEVLTVFAETEVGSNIPFNNEIIADYMNSNSCLSDYFDAKTLEECCDVFTEQVLAGYPVWRMLALPEWTMRQLEKDFVIELNKIEEENKKKYKCLTCKYYKETITGLGVFTECKKEKEAENNARRNRFLLKRKEPLTLKESCKDYAKGTEAELAANIQKITAL